NWPHGKHQLGREFCLLGFRHRYSDAGISRKPRRRKPRPRHEEDCTGKRVGYSHLPRPSSAVYLARRKRSRHWCLRCCWRCGFGGSRHLVVSSPNNRAAQDCEKLRFSHVASHAASWLEIDKRSRLLTQPLLRSLRTAETAVWLLPVPFD